MIQGISYGSIDINLIVAQLVARASAPLDRLQSRQEEFQAQLTSLQLVQSKLSSLQSVLYPLNTVGPSSAFAQKQATSSDESVLTAVASSSAANGVYNITINNLATYHKVASDQFSATGTEISSLEGAGTKTFRITINGVDTDISVDITAGDDNQTVLQNIADAINSSGVEATAIVVNETGSSARLVITSNDSGTVGEMTMQDITGTLLHSSGVLGGVLFFDNWENGTGNWSTMGTSTVVTDQASSPTHSQKFTQYGSGGDAFSNFIAVNPSSVYNLSTDIRVQSGSSGVPYIGVKFYDSGQNLIGESWLIGGSSAAQDITPVSTDTWNSYNQNFTTPANAAYVKIEDEYFNEYGNPLAGAVWFDNIALSDPSASGFKNELVAAQDADFTIDTLNFTRSSNTVDDAINGVTLNLLDTGSVTLTVDQDTDAAISAIQDFVDKYNEAISTIKNESAYDVDTHTGSPLTTDTLIKRITSDLRSLATDIVSGQPDEFNSLFMIGIEVDKEGVMSITDMGKLEAALENNPDEVESLFNSSGAGVAWRIDDYLDTILGPQGRVTNRIDTVNEEIDNIQDDIDEFQAYLDDLEEQLYLQWSKVQQVLTANDSLSLFMAQRLLPTYQQSQGFGY